MKNIFNENENSGGIYKIVNTKNGKFYIGSTKNFKTRSYQHNNLLESGKHKNKHLLNAWNKYGKESFVFVVLEVVYGTTEEIRNVEEQYLVSQYNNGNWNKCYNFQKHTSKNTNRDFIIAERMGKTYEEIFGEDIAFSMKVSQSNTQKMRWTQERRKKYSEMFFGENNPFFGKSHTEETKNKISSSMKGVPLEQRVGEEAASRIKIIFKECNNKRMEDPELRNKLGDMIRGKTLEEIYGSKKAKEIKEKRSKGIAKTYTGFCLLSPAGKKIYKITNMSKFCKENNLCDSHLRSLIKGKIMSHKGWVVIKDKEE